MLLGVAEDVTDGGEGTPVATGWLEVSLGGVPVVVGCGGGTLALGAGGLAPSAGGVLALVRPEAGAEAPSDVAGMALERKGAAVLRGVVKMEGAAGVLAEVAWNNSLSLISTIGLLAKVFLTKSTIFSRYVFVESKESSLNFANSFFIFCTLLIVYNFDKCGSKEFQLLYNLQFSSYCLNLLKNSVREKLLSLIKSFTFRTLSTLLFCLISDIKVL